jgi:aspartate-semialdehyde dehydrogenase
VSTYQYQVGIVGATGAVGQELFRLLLERHFPMAGLRLYASTRSAGRVIERAGRKFTVAEARPEIFQDLDVAFFSAGGPATRALAPAAVKAGCLVLDKSSAFRMDPAVPLVIPEINAHAIRRHQGIIASPNCSTAVTLMGLYPLHRAFGLTRYFAATYQSVSGTGAAAVRELDAQTRAWAKGEPLPRQVYPHQIAFNVIPQVDTFGTNGYTGEENKMAAESRKILEMPDLPVSTTCVREIGRASCRERV